MRKVAIDLFSEAEAESKHLSGKPYAALLGSATKPSCFVEVITDMGMIGVGFLDDKCREYLTCQFDYVDQEKLFLGMATYREFDGDQDADIGGASYIFSESGDLVIRRETFGPHSLEEASSRFDPGRNYEDVPEFGCYSGLTKVER